MLHDVVPVAVRHVRDVSLDGVTLAIQRNLEEIDAGKLLATARRVFVKVNCVSAFLTPGACTSPWVLEGALAALRDLLPAAELIVGDSDSSARKHVDRGYTLWGYREICTRFDVPLVNLSQEGWTKTTLETPKGPVETELSSLALGCDAIVSIPVMKTHTWSQGSCCMKNLYGFLGPDRHNLHLSLSEVIVGLANHFPVSLNIVDGTVGLEAGGPVMGHPREVGLILAGGNPILTDKAVFEIMGLTVEHVEMGLAQAGLPAPPLVGDPVAGVPAFAPPKQNLNSKAHYFLRHLPGSSLLFETVFFHLLRVASTVYQFYWFHRHGSSSRLKFFKTSAWAKQFINRGSIYFGRYGA